MSSTTLTRRKYDHRLRDLIRSSGDISHATQMGIPRSTAYGWLSTNQAEVVTLDVTDTDVIDLQKEVLILRKQT